MPELPEVETVKETLKTKILNKTIDKVEIFYNNIVEFPTNDEFIKNLVNQTIKDIKRRGKWLMLELDDYYLLSHLRMEGKYNIKDKDEPREKHEHVVFYFKDGETLRYRDTRKFGRMHLIKKEDVYNSRPLNELGLEPWDENLTKEYLKDKFKNKKLPIKTLLLDQSIITGIGNIYDDEILFLSKINPTRTPSTLTDRDLDNIITNTKIVLERAIKLGGTTIRTYTSSEGVHGRFQNELLVHTKKTCPDCNNDLEVIKINGRSTYYCNKCQK